MQKNISPSSQISDRIDKKFELIEQISRETRLELNNLQLNSLKEQIKTVIQKIHVINPNNEFNATTKEEIRSHLTKIYNDNTPILRSLHIEHFENFLILFDLDDDIITFNTLPETINIFGKEIKIEFPITYKIQNLSGFRKNLEYLTYNESLLTNLLRDASNIIISPYRNSSNILITGQTEQGTINLLSLAQRPPKIINIANMPSAYEIARDTYLNNKVRRAQLNINTPIESTIVEGVLISGLSDSFQIQRSEIGNQHTQQVINFNISNSYFSIKESEDIQSISHNNETYEYENTTYFRDNLKTETFKSSNNNQITKRYTRNEDNSYSLKMIEYNEVIDNQKFRTIKYFDSNGHKFKTIKYTHQSTKDGQFQATLNNEDLEWRPIQITYFNEDNSEAAILSTNPEQHHMITSTGERIEHYSRMKISNDNISSPREYMNFLASNLITNRDLDLFIQTMIQYTEDKNGDNMQSVTETLNSINENKTQMTGDCEDYANLIKEILRLQNKEALIIAIPGHATTIWLDSLDDNQFRAQSAGTFGVESSPVFGTQEEAINFLFNKYNQTGLGISEGLNYAMYKNFLHLPITSSSENLMDIVSSTTVKLENTNNMYRNFETIISKVEQNQIQEAETLLNQFIAPLSPQEQQLYIINFCKVLINQKKFGVELTSHLQRLEHFNNPSIITHISFIKASIFLENKQWPELKNEIETLKQNTYYKINNYYIFFLKIMNNAPNLYSLNESKQTFENCPISSLKLSIAELLIEKLTTENSPLEAMQVFIDINHKSKRVPSGSENLSNIFTSLIENKHTSQVLELTNFLLNNFNYYINEELQKDYPDIPFLPIFKVLTDTDLLTVLQRLNKYYLSTLFIFTENFLESFRNKTQSLNYLIHPFITSQINALKIDDQLDTESFRIRIQINYIPKLLEMNPSSVEYYQKTIEDTFANHPEEQSLINITRNYFYNTSIEIFLNNLNSNNHSINKWTEDPLLEFIKKSKVNLNINSEEIEKILSEHVNFQAQPEGFKTAFREIVL